MTSVVTYFFDELYAFKESQWLRKLLAVFSIYKCVYWILDYSLLFSADSITYKNNLSLPFWQKPAFLLYGSDSVTLPMSFLGITFLVALYILLSGRKFRLAFFILWFCIVNINNNVYTTLSAGDYLFQHLLFFCIFLSDSTEKATAFKNGIDISFHNAGIIALRLQVCIVYFYAAYAKLLDPDWMNGTAVNGTFSVHEFSMPFLYESDGLTGIVLNYLVIGYQVLFPLLVQLKKIKKWFLLIGVIQHLFIAFVIGLPSFGFIMIIAYSIFYVPGTKNS